jgi:hypothetical protein
MNYYDIPDWLNSGLRRIWLIDTGRLKTPNWLIFKPKESDRSTARGWKSLISWSLSPNNLTGRKPNIENFWLTGFRVHRIWLVESPWFAVFDLCFLDLWPGTNKLFLVFFIWCSRRQLPNLPDDEPSRKVRNASWIACELLVYSDSHPQPLVFS